MRQRYVSPEQNVRPGTEYARSIARYRPKQKRRASWTSYLDHPLAPAVALGLLAAGALMLWPRMAQGRRLEFDGDSDFADFPPPSRQPGRAGLATGLQQGGVTPGHSPGAGVGSIGTGGGSTARAPTGTLANG